MAKWWAITLILFSTLLTSSAQIFLKLSADRLSFDLIKLISNFGLIIGLFLYALGGILLILSFYGGEVSKLYPLIATSYVWVSLFSIYFLGEVMNYLKWMGIIIIIFGIVLISYNSKSKVISVEEPL